MQHKEIIMIAGPFKGNNYQRYDGERKTIHHSIACVDIELIPGNYYRAIPGITTTMLRSPGCMPANFLEANPGLWKPLQ